MTKLFDGLCRDLRNGNWKEAYSTARLIPPLDDVLRVMNSTKNAVTTSDEIADKVFAMPWNDGCMKRAELRRKVKQMCEAAWSIESHAVRIAVGKEEMLDMETRR